MQILMKRVFSFTQVHGKGTQKIPAVIHDCLPETGDVDHFFEGADKSAAIQCLIYAIHLMIFMQAIQFI